MGCGASAPAHAAGAPPAGGAYELKPTDLMQPTPGTSPPLGARDAERQAGDSSHGASAAGAAARGGERPPHEVAKRKSSTPAQRALALANAAADDCTDASDSEFESGGERGGSGDGGAVAPGPAGAAAGAGVPLSSHGRSRGANLASAPAASTAPLRFATGAAADANGADGDGDGAGGGGLSFGRAVPFPFGGDSRAFVKPASKAGSFRAPPTLPAPAPFTNGAREPTRTGAATAAAAPVAAQAAAAAAAAAAAIARGDDDFDDGFDAGGDGAEGAAAGGEHARAHAAAGAAPGWQGARAEGARSSGAGAGACAGAGAGAGAGGAGGAGALLDLAPGAWGSPAANQHGGGLGGARSGSLDAADVDGAARRSAAGASAAAASHADAAAALAAGALRTSAGSSHADASFHSLPPQSPLSCLGPRDVATPEPPAPPRASASQWMRGHSASNVLQIGHGVDAVGLGSGARGDASHGRSQRAAVDEFELETADEGKLRATALEATGGSWDATWRGGGGHAALDGGGDDDDMW